MRFTLSCSYGEKSGSCSGSGQICHQNPASAGFGKSKSGTTLVMVCDLPTFVVEHKLTVELVVHYELQITQ